MAITYNYEEAFENSLKYFNGDDLAAKVFVDKYALQDSKGRFYELTPEDMHRRIAKEFARIEKNKFKDYYTEQEIFELFKNFKYIIPQGSPMFGIGNKFQTISLSNCFVLETPKDSYGSIMKIDEQLVQMSKRRGGVGFDISNIRPKNSPINNAARTSTGIVSFMERFSNSIREVGQYGRRGALLLSISINHIDIEDFITVKNDLTKVTGANISIRITNEFLDAVKNDDDFYLKFPVDSDNPIIKKKIKAKYLWDKIVENAWLMGEPGLLLWDNIINESIPDCYSENGFKTVSTNPCLTGDTFIKTVKGDKTIKEIVDLYQNKEILPKIISYNIETKEIEEDVIFNAQLTKNNANIIELEMEDGEVLKLTPDHQVYTENRGYVKASQLLENDIIISIK
jgi:ribonucleoside-diphosphate reductase alpha chain